MNAKLLPAAITHVRQITVLYPNVDCSVLSGKILQQCSQLLQEISHVTKSGNSNKFKMASAAILNLVYHPWFACYCIYVHKIWQVDSFGLCVATL